MMRWEQVEELGEKCWDRLEKKIAPERLKTIAIYGVPTGGGVVGLVMQKLGLKRKYEPKIAHIDEIDSNTLIIDDLVDSGRTMSEWVENGYTCEALFRKPHSPGHFKDLPVIDGWVHFPWEHDQEPTDSVVRLLEFCGEDCSRDGLLKTPDRVLRWYAEMTTGYNQDPAEILKTQFEAEYDEMILLSDIEFTSLCEHHLLPFTGKAHIGYVPKIGGKVVGISKLARIVECFGKRFQIQERMTRQIGEAIQENLDPQGVGVILKASHHCMGCRGVKKPGAQMTTSCVLGIFKQDEKARSEFLNLISL